MVRWFAMTALNARIFAGALVLGPVSLSACAVQDDEHPSVTALSSESSATTSASANDLAQVFTVPNTFRVDGYYCGNTQREYHPLFDNQIQVLVPMSAEFVNLFNGQARYSTPYRLDYESNILHLRGGSGGGGLVPCPASMPLANCQPGPTLTLNVSLDLRDGSGNTYFLSNDAGHALCGAVKPFILKVVRTTAQTTGACRMQYEMTFSPISTEQVACIKRQVPSATTTASSAWFAQPVVEWSAVSELGCQWSAAIHAAQYCSIRDLPCEIPFGNTRYSNFRTQFIHQGVVRYDSRYLSATCQDVFNGTLYR